MYKIKIISSVIVAMLWFSCGNSPVTPLPDPQFFVHYIEIILSDGTIGLEFFGQPDIDIGIDSIGVSSVGFLPAKLKFQGTWKFKAGQSIPCQQQNWGFYKKIGTWKVEFWGVTDQENSFYKQSYLDVTK